MLLAVQSYSFHWDTRYWCSRFCRKSFSSIIFLIIKVHLRNESNLNTHNNLYSSSYWHYNHALHIETHDIDALDLQEKLFLPPLSSKSMFILDIRQTWIIISIPFFIVTNNMFSSLGYKMLKLWIGKKSFSFNHFPFNQSSSVI